METLYEKLKAIIDSYPAFVIGVMVYVKQKPDARLQTVLDFLDSSEDFTSSDVVKFIIEQPDFHEFGY